MSVINFIYSVSGLLTNEITLENSKTEFKNAIESEPDNPLIPLLYSIYISRVGAKNMASIDFLRYIGELRNVIKDNKIKDMVSIQILTASLSKIWEDQQVIRLISDNLDNLDVEPSKQLAAEAFESYKAFILYANGVMATIPRNENSRDFLDQSSSSLQKYFSEINNLGDIVKEINNKQIGITIQGN